MECHSKKPLLLLFLVLCCLLLVLPLTSSVPMSRSLRLRNQQRPRSLKLTSQAAPAVNLGNRAAASMALEVDDYATPGANNRHNPYPPQGPGSGRA